MAHGSFPEIPQALTSDARRTRVDGSRYAPEASPARLPKTREQPVVLDPYKAESVHARQEIPVIDREALRKSVFEDKKRPFEDRMGVAETFQEVVRLLNETTGLSGSRYYSPYELHQQIDRVQAAILQNKFDLFPTILDTVTSAKGVREAVKRAAASAFQGRW